MRALMSQVVRIVVAVVLAFGLGGAAYAQSCPSAAPVLVYPADGATNVPRDPSSSVTVKWNAVASATQYDVYFGPKNSGCAASSPRATVTGTTFSPPASEIVNGAEYEWRVVAKGVQGCTIPRPSGCAHFKMNICPAAAPVLTEPANNSVVGFGEIVLKWQEVPNAAFYELFIAVDGGAPTPLGSTTARQKTITVEPGRAIQWAVRASAPGCTGFLASVFSFTTTCPTTGAVLTTPSNGATFTDDATILFTWTAVEGASGYGFYRSLDQGQTWVLVANNISVRSYAAKFGAGNWMWRIRANFSGACPPIDSAASSFIVTNTACNNAPPILIAPPDGSSHTLPVTLAWTAPAGAKSFQILTAGPDGPKQVGTTTGNSFVLTSLDPGTYQWFVIAKFDGCPDVESARRTITITKAECTPATISLTSPANGANVPSPALLSWTAIPNATAYRVWASYEGSAPVLLTRTSATSATLPLPAGSFKWRVEGIRNDCPSVLSPEGSFTVPAGANCGANSAPELLPPEVKDDPSTERKSIVLPWIAKNSATYYRVWVALFGQPFEDVGVTRETHIERTLPGGRYRWFVQAFFEGCPLLASAVGEFTVEASASLCSSDPPIVAEPVHNSTVETLRFRITEIETGNRNVRYRFFAIVDRAGSAPEIVFLGASTTPEFEPKLQLPPGTYQAFVERSVDECPSTFSDRITFTIARAQNCPSVVPRLVSPANGAQIPAGMVPMQWAWDASFPGAKFVLFLQVNDGAATPVGPTTETTLNVRVPPGRIRWWVVVFLPGCDPLISERFTFRAELPQGCPTAAPVGLQPADGARLEAGDVTFEWSAQPLAHEYKLFVIKDGGAPTLVATTTGTRTTVPLGPGSYNWILDVTYERTCPPNSSAAGSFTVVEAEPCGTPGKPKAHVVGQAVSGSPYRVRWSPLAHVKTYEVQESTTADFASAKTFFVTETSMGASQTIAAGAVQEFFYRVRGLSDCNDEHGPYSEAVRILIVNPRTGNASAEVGTSDDVVQQIVLRGSATPRTFNATVDKPWLKVSPSSGTVGTEDVTLTLTGDPDQLNLGTNTATVKVTSTDAAANGVQTQATAISPIPINISLVTPVTPGGKSAPPPDALIFPVVGHAAGVNDSLFETDIRVTNLAATTTKYQVTFTPSGVDGTTTGNSSTIEVAPNQTVALDDIVSSVFGTTSSIIGMLEVRPLTSSSTPTGFTPIGSGFAPLLTAASSRTYNFTPTGTFGQFIPAVPFAKFVGRATSGPNPILALQQVAQSVAYRANFGFAEGSGQPADLLMRVYDTAGTLLATIPISLGASQHQQLNGLLASNGINDLADGRVEIEVTNGNGKVTAYVSEIDNRTNDPLLVTAVPKGSISSNRYVLPGMAYIDNGFAFWVSDVRIFNAGSTSTPATLTFYPEGNPGAAVSKDILLDAGEIEVLDNAVGTFFGQPKGAGGQIVITTPQNTTLTATARTYNQTSNGTYGQYIPGITPAESVGAADRALQILQLETSPRLRSNIGLSETTGNPVTVEVSVIQSDPIVTPFVQIPLAANEFRQISLAGFFEPDAAVYNARVTVKVISGTGRVTAYGSAIDAITQDPTYVTAQ